MGRKAFTLVELIITIAIIAVLAVTAIVMITKWISKSRDSTRLSDISIIQKSLETNIVNSKTYLMPDNAVNIYDTGNALAWYQWEFTDKVSEKLWTFRLTPKDPQWRNYGYSLSNDKKQYQIRAFLENTSYNNYINTTNAATQISKISGNYNGFLVTTTWTTYNLWNVSTLFVWSGTVISSWLNYLNDNNKPSDNMSNLAVANVSGLYDTSSANDSSTLDAIVSTFSGTNSITSQSLAQLTMKTAAGWVTLLADAWWGSCNPTPCTADNWWNCSITQSNKSLLDTDLTWANIKSWVNIFGMTWSYVGRRTYCRAIYWWTVTNYCEVWTSCYSRNGYHSDAYYTIYVSTSPNSVICWHTRGSWSYQRYVYTSPWQFFSRWTVCDCYTVN